MRWSVFSKLTLLFILTILLLLLTPWLSRSPEGWISIGQIPWTIITQLRIPRMLAAFFSGAILSLTGLVFQAYFKNWLASPYTLGVSSGAAAGASIWILASSMLGFTGLYLTTLAALGGGLLAIGLIMVMIWRKKYTDSSTLLLGGIAANFLFSSCTILSQLLANQYDSAKIVRWLMGNIVDISTYELLPIIIVALPIFLLFSLRINDLNLISLGDEFALSRGVSLRRARNLFLGGGALMTATVVACCGPIGFVGIICPHICRLIFGENHQVLLPASLLFGGSFLVVCDTISRLCFTTFQLPLGVMTSLLGIPIFLWLLFRSSES